MFLCWPAGGAGGGISADGGQIQAVFGRGAGEGRAAGRQREALLHRATGTGTSAVEAGGGAERGMRRSERRGKGG